MSECASPGRIRPGDLKNSSCSPKKGAKVAFVGGEQMRVTREDVDMAFQFFDPGSKGVLKSKDLKQKLEIFFPNLTTRDYKLMISEPNFTSDTLWQLIQDNLSLMKDFDPAQEAFKTFDPEGTGYLDTNTLKQIMMDLGHGTMSDEGFTTLIQSSDLDNDGKINLSDFRGMVGFYPQFSKSVESHSTLTDD